MNPPIPQRPGLAEDERRVESTVCARVEASLDELVASYRARFGQHFSSDNAARLFPEYDESAETRLAYRAAVTGASHRIADTALLQRISEPDLAPVTFVIGGPGAGKTTSAVAALQAGDIVFDGSAVHAEKLIDAAARSSRDVNIEFVLREPVEAFRATLHRAMTSITEPGRVIPLELHARLHAGSAKVILKFAENYQRRPNVAIFVTVNRSIGPAQVGSIEDVRRTDYTDLSKRLKHALDEEFALGHISRAIYERVGRT